MTVTLYQQYLSWTPFIKTAHKNENYSAHFQITTDVGLFSGSLIFSPGFPLDSVPSVNGFFCELCLFQVQWWLTHSSRVITSRLTRRCLVDYTVNETCSEGGHFREIPLKRGYPRCRGNPLCPLPLIVLATPKLAQRTCEIHYVFPTAFHSFSWRPCKCVFFFSMPRHCGMYGLNSFQTAGRSIALFSLAAPRAVGLVTCVICGRNALKCSYTCWHT